jgi:hypothetical protein
VLLGTVQRTRVFGVGASGILAALGSLITHNQVFGANDNGLEGQGAVLDNVVHTAGAHGIRANGTVESNLVIFAGAAGAAAGIHCIGRCSITHNSVSNTTGAGVLVDGSATVIANSIATSSGLGLESIASANIGYGANNLAGNNGGGAQVGGPGIELQVSTNMCQAVACP